MKARSAVGIVGIAIGAAAARLAVFLKSDVDDADLSSTQLARLRDMGLLVPDERKH